MNGRRIAWRSVLGGQVHADQPGFVFHHIQLLQVAGDLTCAEQPAFVELQAVDIAYVGFIGVPDP